MMKHTPAPWFAWRNSSYWEISAKNSNPEKFSFDIGNVCASSPGDRDGGLQEANARLISAAPELLEALEEVTGILEMVLGVAGGYPTEADGPAIKARNAIAKARGENE
jgi:hypothetical protein